MEIKANEKTRIALLPGDILKLVIEVDKPLYLNLEFEDANSFDCVAKVKLCSLGSPYDND